MLILSTRVQVKQMFLNSIVFLMWHNKRPKNYWLSLARERGEEGVVAKRRVSEHSRIPATHGHTATVLQLPLKKVAV